jgi:hypothetical protein
MRTDIHISKCKNFFFTMPLPVNKIAYLQLYIFDSNRLFSKLYFCSNCKL